MHYRVYKLDPSGRITRGEWIEADSESQALATAQTLCDQVTPSVEVWQGARRIAVLPCSDDQAA